MLLNLVGWHVILTQLDAFMIKVPSSWVQSFNGCCHKQASSRSRLLHKTPKAIVLWRQFINLLEQFCKRQYIYIHLKLVYWKLRSYHRKQHKLAQMLLNLVGWHAILTQLDAFMIKVPSSWVQSFNGCCHKQASSRSRLLHKTPKAIVLWRQFINLLEQFCER